MKISVPWEEIRKKKLFLATPMYGGQCLGAFARSAEHLAARCQENGVPFRSYYMFNESLITRARNYCADEFLRSDADFLVFIDADIGFNPMDVLKMMAIAMSDEKYDILAAPYPKKCIAWEKVAIAVDKGIGDPRNPDPQKRDPDLLSRFVGDYVVNLLPGTKEIPLGEPFEVLEAGTGFMMIRRDVFERFEKAYPHYAFKPDHSRTEHFDGSRLICQFFQAEIDRPDALTSLRPALESIAAGEIDAAEKAREALASYDAELARSSLRYLSEDYFFCQKARKGFGARTWMIPWMKLEHTGTYTFGGSIPDLCSVGAPLTSGKKTRRTGERGLSGPVVNLPVKKFKERKK